jgi:hypothetical protein
MNSKSKNLTKEEMLTSIEEMLIFMQLQQYRKANSYDLSGGQQQKLAIAKVLLLNPEILLLDEPTKGIDPYFKHSLADLFKKLLKKDLTIIMVSHDIEFCAQYGLNNRTMKQFSNYSCSPNEVYCQPDENWRMAVLTKTFSNGILAHLCEGSWHPDEPDNTLARQMAISMMGFVPEVQVDLTRLPPGHELVLKRFFAFYSKHREALLRGEFTPFGFEHMLGGPLSTTPPHVKIETENEAFYFVGPVVCSEISLRNSTRSVYLFNLKNLGGLDLTLTGLAPGKYEITQYDCYMNTVSQAEIISAGALPLSSPVGSGAMLSVKYIDNSL